jgi:hypothetical protein
MKKVLIVDNQITEPPFRHWIAGDAEVHLARCFLGAAYLMERNVYDLVGIADPVEANENEKPPRVAGTFFTDGIIKELREKNPDCYIIGFVPIPYQSGAPGPFNEKHTDERKFYESLMKKMGERS